MDPVVDPKHRQAIENIVVLPIISKQNSHHINLNDHIVSLYGRDILDEFHELEKLRVKIKRTIVDTPH
jgi:hypothetical protein